MADEVAKTSLVFDASGAKQGAADFVASSDKVIAAAEKSAAAVVEANNRIVRSSSQQIATLDRYAKAWDPLAASAGRAAKQLETIWDIAQKTRGDVQVRALGMMTEAVDRLNKATRDLSMGFDVDKRIEQLTAKFDPAQASVRAMVAELAELNQAQQLGVSIAGGYVAAQSKIVAGYNEGAQAAAKAAAQQREMIVAARASQTAAQTGPDPRTLLGLGGAPGAGSAAASAAVFEEAAAAQDALAKQTERLTALFQPATVAAEQYKSALQDVDAALNLGVISTDESIAAQNKAREAYNRTITGNKGVGDSAFAARFATQQLGVQTVQFFSSLEAGQPFMQAFIGQAHQIVDVSIATGTGFKVLAQGVASFFTAIGRFIVGNPLLVGLGLIATAIAGIAIAAESMARKLIDLSQQLRVVTSDYAMLASTIDKASKTAGATTTLSTSQARTVQQSIVTQAAFSPRDEASLVRLSKLTADLARTFNEDLATAATRVATALQSPAKAAQDLADKQFPGMTQAIARHVDILVKQGKVAEAQTIVMDAYTKSVDNASEEGTTLQKTMIELGKQFDQLKTNLGSVIDSMITGIQRLRQWLKDKGIIPGDDFNYNARPPTQTTSQLVNEQTAALQAAFPSLFTTGGTVLKGPVIPGRDERASGAMQVMPSTAAARGLPAGFIDENAGQNIIAGLGLLNDLFKQYGSDMRAITKAYGGFGDANTAGLDLRMTAQKNANTAGLPTDIQGGIKFIAQRFGWPDWLTQLALQMTVLESRGNQFTQTVAPNAANAGNVKTGTEQFGPGAGIDAITQARINDAQKRFDALIPGQREAMKAEIDGLKQLRDQLGANSEAGKQITAALGPMEGQLKNLRTETEQFTKSQQDQTRVSGIEEGAAKRLADAYLQLDEASIKETGHAATAAQKEAARSEIMKGLSKDMQLVIETAQRQITANEELAKAVEQGNGALEKRQALIQAQQEATAFGPRGSPEYNAAVPVLTQKNIDIASSAQDITAAQQSRVNQDTIRMLQLETDTLGMNYDQRTLLLAHQKAELDIKRQYPIASKEYTTALQSESDKIAQVSLDLAKQQHALDTITGMFESAFDTISNSITQALVSGQGAAVNWRNVMTSVAQQVLSAFLKLAILNPILNMINPSGNRDTLGSLFGELNKTTPASGSSSSSGGGGTGIFGGLFSLVASIGSLFGGGSAAAGTALSGLSTASTNMVVGLGGSGFGATAALQAAPGGIYHSGGIVGVNDNNPMRSIPAAMIANAPRFHSGYSGVRSDELPAILQRGERVLTQRDDDRISSTIGGMTDKLASGMAEGNNSRADTASRGDNVTISIDARNSTPQAVDSFRRSLPQIASVMSDQMARAKARNG